MDASILIQIWDFLYETGIFFVLLGAIFTAIVSRVALVPALKKIDAIIDCFIEKAEDGEVTPEDAAVIFSVIKEQIGSDFLVKIFGWLFKANVPTEKLQGLTCK